MRHEFAEIVAGGLASGDLDALSDCLERASNWTRRHMPLEEDEARAVTVMLERQIALTFVRPPNAFADCQLPSDCQCLLHKAAQEGYAQCRVPAINRMATELGVGPLYPRAQPGPGPGRL